MNPAKNITIFGFFSNYPVMKYFTENNSAVVFGKSDHLWAHIASSSATELTALLARHHQKTKYYFSVEDWMIPCILAHGAADWIMTTNRFVLDESISPELPTLEMITIDRSFAPFMYSHSNYKDYISLAYIEDRLRKDVSAGILVNNTLVAWGFTHDDGALGFLHVLEGYRNKGYGMNILLGLIHKRKETKRPVFGNIVPGNEASTRLVKKLGFQLDCKSSWIKLK